MTLSASQFRDLVQEETRRLTNMCQHWESVPLEPGISDEAKGYIRTAIGQANLLMKERFAQFVTLTHSCEQNLGEKKITCEDLQGFWDVIYFQVEDIDRKFDQLIKLQESAWHIEQTNEATEVKTTKPIPKRSVPTELQKARAAASRKRLAEAKARMACTTSKQAPAALHDKENAIVFEAPNFFLVSSPRRPEQTKPRMPQEVPVGVHSKPKKKNILPQIHVTNLAKKALVLHN